jgi:hypothetical protein
MAFMRRARQEKKCEFRNRVVVVNQNIGQYDGVSVGSLTPFFEGGYVGSLKACGYFGESTGCSYLGQI